MRRLVDSAPPTYITIALADLVVPGKIYHRIRQSIPGFELEREDATDTSLAVLHVRVLLEKYKKIPGDQTRDFTPLLFLGRL